MWEKPRWEEAALKRSSARCAEGEDAMRRASSGWWRYRGGRVGGGGGGGGGGDGGAPRAGVRYCSGEIHGSAGGGFIVNRRLRTEARSVSVVSAFGEELGLEQVGSRGADLVTARWVRRRGAAAPR